MRAIPLRFERLPHYLVLLIAMLGEIVVVPILVETGPGLRVARISTGVVLAAALWAVGPTRTNLTCFAIAAVALTIGAFNSDPRIAAAELGLRGLFVAYVAGTILWNVLQKEQVTFDTIAGSACAYMLIGLAWAPIYLMVEKLRPGSFDIPPSWRVGPDGDLAPAMVYFSYATLTTVGYGDIHASDPVAGGLVVVEAVLGTLYLAITVARLVGLHIANRE
jgi:hypothetical protein